MAFPPEIWRIVLHSFGTERQDLVELWTGCRGVSKHFKHEIEELFIADYLPRTSLRFDITTSQGFNRNSRIEFHDHQAQTFYNRISADRAQAFFRAKDDDKARLLKQMHSGGGFSGPSHLVDLSRPSHNIALPGIFFHANGDIGVDWRALFAALLAEEKYYYRTRGIPAKFPTNEESANESTSEKGMGASTVEQLFREAEIFESYMSKATQTEAPHARVFRMVISHGYYTDLEEHPDPQSTSTPLPDW